jgi:cation transport regulator ChaC
MGWARRFWQSSPDHRGHPDAPGLVVTLVPAAGDTCGGCAYRIDPAIGEALLCELDAREQAGFERHVLTLLDAPGGAPFADGIAYVAVPANPHFAGPLDEHAVADRMRTRRGPSGTNVDYALRLHEALGALGIDDPHVDAVVRLLPKTVPRA